MEIKNKTKKLYLLKNGGAYEVTLEALRQSNTKTEMEEYHSNRKLAKLTTNKRETASTFKGFGFEIEIENLNDDDENLNDLIEEINENYGGLFGFESDGSLDYGVEIVSRPMCLDVINSLDFRKLANIIDYYNYGSTYHTGGHIHVSSTLFGSNEQTQKRTLLNILMFMETNKNLIKTISGRERQSTYAEPITCGRNENPKRLYNEIRAILNGVSFERYSWVNLNNWFGYKNDGYGINTIEFRFFGSCFDNTLKDRANWLYELIKTAKKIRNSWGRGYNTNKENWFKINPTFKELTYKLVGGAYECVL